MQREFWLQIIQLPKRAGRTPFLQVGHLHYPMLLRQMVPWERRCLHDPLQMVQFLPVRLCHCDLHLHKWGPSHPCRWVGNHRGLASHSNQGKQFHPLSCLHRRCSNSGHILRACHLHHPLHSKLKFFRGRRLHQWVRWLQLCGGHHHPLSRWLGGPQCLMYRCHRLPHLRLLHLQVEQNRSHSDQLAITVLEMFQHFYFALGLLVSNYDHTVTL